MNEERKKHDISNKILSRINTIYNILEKEHPQGVRELAYTIESQGLIQHTDKDFRGIEYACRVGRKKGLIPFGWIEDESRYDYYIPPFGYNDVNDFIDTLDYRINTFEKPFWSFQPNYFEVLVEKLGLAHFYEDVCKKYYVRLVPVKGDSSYSQEQEIVRRYKERLLEGKKCYILYLGDFNWNGFNIPKAILRNVFDFGGFKPRDIKFIRIALDFDHVLRYPDLPYNPNPAKSDSSKTKKRRFLEICREHGIKEDKNIELEALKVHHPKEHLTTVENAICNLLDKDAWDTWERDSEQDRKFLKEKFKGMKSK